MRKEKKQLDYISIYKDCGLSEGIIRILADNKLDGRKHWGSSSLIDSIDHDIANVGQEYFQKEILPIKAISIALSLILEGTFEKAKEWLQKGSQFEAEIITNNMKQIRSALNKIYKQKPL